MQNLFRLAFLKDKTNSIFVGGVGLAKTHPASALAHEACLRGHSVLITTAAEIINTLPAAHRFAAPCQPAHHKNFGIPEQRLVRQTLMITGDFDIRRRSSQFEPHFTNSEVTLKTLKTPFSPVNTK